MDSTDLAPNPIVFFASFLIFLSYIYNKVLQNRPKTSEEGRFHEYYNIQEHYAPHAPHVQTTIAQELPRIFEEQPRRAHYRNGNGFMNHHEEKDFVNNYVPYKPVARPSQDESLSQDDGWTAREPEFGLADVSAIHPLSRTKGASVDNSLLDYPIFDPREGEQLIAAVTRNEMLIEEANGDSKKKVTTKVVVQRRREVVYQESSESENDGRSLSQGNLKNQNRVNRKNGNMMNESIANRKRQIEFEESYQNSHDMHSRDLQGFTDFEPGITKKSQQHDMRAAVPNGKVTKVTEEPLVKVKEIFDLPSRTSSKKKALEKDSKASAASLKTKHSEAATTDEDASKRKFIKPMVERGREATKSRKELLREESPLDLTYLEEYGTNMSLKKYVAKKTVQEQAFRGSGYASDETSKKTLADLAGPRIVAQPQQTSVGSNSGLFQKPGETSKSSTGGSGLFGNGPAASSGSGSGSGAAAQSSTTSSLFGNLNSAGSSKPTESTSVATANTETKSSGLFGPAGATENKNSGLFSNITEKKAEAAQKPAEAKPAGVTDTSKSLFGDASASSSLFGPGVTAQKTQAPAQQTPAPAAASNTTSSSLFGPSATAPTTATSENKSLPRVNASEDLTKPPQQTQQTNTSSLFGNLTQAAAPAASNTNTSGGLGLNLGLGGLASQSEKKELMSSLFVNNTNANTNTNAAAPAEEKKSGLFGNLTNQAPASTNNENKPPPPATSLFSQGGAHFSQTPAQSQPQTQNQTQAPSQPAAEPKKEEQKTSSLFGGFANAGGSSGLFGQTKPEPPKEPAPQTQPTNNESPPSKGLLATFGSKNQSPQQPAAGGTGLAGLFGGNSGGNSINPNVGAGGSAKSSLFGGSLSKPEGGSTGSGFFGNLTNNANANSNANQAQGQNQQQSTGGGLAMFQNQNNSPQKPAGESATSSLLFGQNNTGAGTAAPNGGKGLLGMFGGGNNNASAGSSGGLFSTIQAGSSGSGLFGNQNNANQGSQPVTGLNALLKK